MTTMAMPRVETVRRLPAATSVTELMARDHEHLEALEQGAFEMLALGETSAGQAAWRDFASGMRHHMLVEEQLLFPAYERAVLVRSVDGAETDRLRAEHRAIERVLEALADAFAGNAAALPLRADLHRLLGQHEMQELRVLYPRADGTLTAEEREALVARMQSMM